MKIYNISNRISKQALSEIKRIINTHKKYSKMYFSIPNASAYARTMSVRNFKKLNPDVSFLKNGTLIIVKFGYNETPLFRVDYKLIVTSDETWKDESSKPILKNISFIKNLLK